MKIERIDEMALDAATGAEIAALLDACFDGGFEGRSYFLTRHHRRLVAREGARIVGHLALGLRLIRLGDRLVDVACVAEVATAPDRRGAGIATGLLASAIGAARDTGAAFVLLYGNAGLYAAAGLRPVRNLTRRVDLTGRRTVAVVEEPALDLLVLALGDAVWDETAVVDLLGGEF